MHSLSHRLLSSLPERRVRTLARRVARRAESRLRSAKLERIEEWLPAGDLRAIVAYVQAEGAEEVAQ